MRASSSLAPQLVDYLRLGTLLMPDNSGGEVSSEGLHTCVSVISLYSDVIESSRGNALTRCKMQRRSGFISNSKSEVLLEFIRRFELISEMLCDRALANRKFMLLLIIELAKACCKIQNCRKGREINYRSDSLGLTRAHRFQLSWSHVDIQRFRWWLAGSSIHALRPVVYLALMQKFGNKSWIPWITSFFIDALSEALSTHPNFLSKQTIKNMSHQSFQGCTVADDSNKPKSYGTKEMDTSREPQSSEASELDLQAVVDDEPRVEGTRREMKDLHRLQMRAAAIELILQKEIQRRRGLLLLYLFRPPVFQTLLVPLIKLLQRLTSRIPILGALIGVLLEMLMSLGRYYFYTAGT
ncbi:hypothetical protein GUITHDRAFT_153679 [Guillardia theta CCMP2712]|uniref:Peroxisomal membrane protein PEX16 n=1 Tax=Guillardia theta (strain CCMP2712) TaxID=905079 RepID=L1J080_GUITC|nr:hypothetical protein GUITHDRAFT_153679 [Guillardia theta CCMP2712]EKX41891.1 hypothetical protein GUITHDRAFT_153679 [Guillardia theta CCMP2712]|eukprot:XP_005828871.1 hypothetical protein GUITHDRAFT_153679 [Guillardia theta CCMP2712]